MSHPKDVMEMKVVEMEMKVLAKNSAYFRNHLHIATG